uniref:(California timema) hypothetical protein n=1 Tax=Timema californicum TaxID=61474 RepID=A0A7R9PA80_TIMCA|nr:unnamed protein product [Timema californicum]
MCVSPAFKTMKRLTHFSQASKCAFVPSKQNHRIWSNVPIKLQPCVINATNLYNSRLTQPPSWLLKYSVVSCFKQSGWYSIFCRSWRYGNNLCLQPHSKILGSYSKLVVCRKYSSKSEDQKDIKNRDIVHEVLQRKKERLKETGQLIIKDIKETRDKMKEKMEEVIERENIWTIPNLLCILRIGFSPLLGYFIVQSDFNLALALLTLAGISDVVALLPIQVIHLSTGLVIGKVEFRGREHAFAWRESGKQFKKKPPRSLDRDSNLYHSFLGSLAQHETSVLANYATNAVILTGTIIARDLLLVGAGFYIRYQSLPLPQYYLEVASSRSGATKLLTASYRKLATTYLATHMINLFGTFQSERTLSRYFDVTYATAQLAPTTISKVNTAVQLLMVASTLAAPVFNYVDHSVLHMLCCKGSSRAYNKHLSCDTDQVELSGENLSATDIYSAI